MLLVFIPLPFIFLNIEYLLDSRVQWLDNDQTIEIACPDFISLMVCL